MVRNPLISQEHAHMSIHAPCHKLRHNQQACLHTLCLAQYESMREKKKNMKEDRLHMLT